jgi:hypothetical protein
MGQPLQIGVFAMTEKTKNPPVNGWGCMYYLSMLRRGTVRERCLAFWGRKGKRGAGRKEFS